MQLNRWLLGLGAFALAGAVSIASAQSRPDAAPSALAAPAVNEPLTVNALLGTVEGQPLFVQDVLKPVDKELRGLAAKAQSVRDFRDAARQILGRQLQDKISRIVMYHAALSHLTSDDRQRIDMFVDLKRKEIITQHAGSAAMAEKALEAQGSSLDKELADLRRTATTELYFRRLFWHRITITRQQLLDAYQQNLAQFTVPAQVDLYTITLRVSQFLPKQKDSDHPIDHPTPAQLAAAQDQAMAEARDLIQQIKAGADFAQLAEDHSVDPFAKNGGRRRPAVKRGDLANQALENKAFSLPANSVDPAPLVVKNDDPAQTQIIIVKVGEVDPGRVIPFAEAQDTLKAEITNRQLRQMQNEFMQTVLKSAAIEAVGGSINTPTDVATQRMLGVAVDAAVAHYAM